uniref:C-type lectin domain-containing protein n=1 Tax=Anser brachyrhynchus TaxID=132585 RepID=A0A8B9BI47_9AVES
MMPPRRGAKEMSEHRSCFGDAAVLLEVVAGLRATGVRKGNCSENGIGFGEKCFYFVEEEADWNRSQSFCLSRRAQLATIDSQEDLHFLLRYGRALHYWVGLQREGSNPWRWFNGSLFNNLYVLQRFSSSDGFFSPKKTLKTSQLFSLERTTPFASCFSRESSFPASAPQKITRFSSPHTICFV